MLFLVVIVLIIGLIVFYATVSSSGNSNATSRVQMAARDSAMPKDAHDQVEKLAQFIYVVYRDDPSARYCNPHGYLDIIQDRNGTVTLEFGYNWDYGLAEQHVRKNYPALDSGIKFRDGGAIYYETTNVENIAWIFDPVTNKYTTDLVIRTLLNECPGLQITRNEATASGIRLSFKYQ